MISSEFTIREKCTVSDAFAVENMLALNSQLIFYVVWGRDNRVFFFPNKTSAQHTLARNVP